MTCDKCSDKHPFSTSVSNSVGWYGTEGLWNMTSIVSSGIIIGNGSTETTGIISSPCDCGCHRCGHKEVEGTKCHAKPDHWNLVCKECGLELTPCKCGEGLE